jgi:hypothetical protein
VGIAVLDQIKPVEDRRGCTCAWPPKCQVEV